LALACDSMVKGLVFFLNWRYLGLDEANQEAAYAENPTAFIASSSNSEEAPVTIKVIYDDLLILHLVYASIIKACDDKMKEEIVLPRDLGEEVGFWQLPQRYIEAPPVAQLMLEFSDIANLDGIMVPFAIAPLSMWNQIRTIEVAIDSVRPAATFAGGLQDIATGIGNVYYTAFVGLPLG